MYYIVMDKPEPENIKLDNITTDHEEKTPTFTSIEEEKIRSRDGYQALYIDEYVSVFLMLSGAGPVEHEIYPKISKFVTLRRFRSITTRGSRTASIIL